LFNPYWQITETKSENREITHCVSRKQNPEKFEKSLVGNVTGRVLRKQNPDHHFWKWNLLERTLLIMMTNFFSTGR